MSKRGVVGMLTAAAMVAAVGAGPIAFAKSKPPTPSCDMNLRFQVSNLPAQPVPSRSVSTESVS
jgi:hypothetical protein